MLDAIATGHQAAVANAKTLSELRYGADGGALYLSGIQALARLPIDQRRADIRADRNTAGFISGYRGSPLGGLDMELLRQSATFKALGIVFEPGINEDLAATAVWGSQQVGLFPGARPDGVFGLWYGKAPGLDRSSDAVRHANAAGVNPLGGVVLAVGDDPGCKSSTLPSASEFALRDLGIPVLAPAHVADVLDFGLFGWALSRYAGCWAGMLAVTDVMDSSMSVHVDARRRAFVHPNRDVNPHIRLADSPLEQEARMELRLRLATSFGAANGINRLITDPERPRLVVVTAGKTYTDVREALAKLGFASTADVADAGIRLVKLGMTWPLDADFVKRFRQGARRLLVVEQKRPFVEEQLRAMLCGVDSIEVLGKGATAAPARTLVSATGELDVPAIAAVLAETLGIGDNGYLAETRAAAALVGATQDSKTARLPLYCPGCPHNRSTRLPAGSRAGAGIGCHYMAQWMERETHLPTHMGGEGVNWIGQAPFTDEKHIFANLGDGTYFHSGLLAIRAAVAAGVNVTYKVLVNDAVAMTGGQAVEGSLSVADIVAQVRAEGVTEVRVVTDDVRRYRRLPWRRARGNGLPRAVRVLPRGDLDAAQRALRALPGCTVLVYDQTCAAELRRRRKRGLAEDPDVRVVINDAVCEGCGDCTAQSSCAAIEPLDTELGVKRAINQNACNKDLSCLEGYCPALVTVRGARLRRRAPTDLDGLRRRLPLPKRQPERANVLLAGVGGTGVVTVSQLLGVAAHLDGKFASTLDATGLAQKGGAVLSHVRISPATARHEPTRVPACDADVLVAADAVAATGRDVLAMLAPKRTTAVVNGHVAPTADFVLAAGGASGFAADGDRARLRDLIRPHTRSLVTVDAESATKTLFGVATTANVFLLGYAFQLGVLPVSLAALERAITLNAVAVDDNLAAFHHGRAATRDAAAPSAPSTAMQPPLAGSLAQRVDYRRALLAAYQDEALGRRYESLVEQIRVAEATARPGSTALAATVAESYYALLAAKDEYEVARLFVNDFDEHLGKQFERYRATYHFAPSWIPWRDVNGRPRKVAVAAWLAVPLLRLLAKARRLRGGPFDPFRWCEDRRLERQLRLLFEADFEKLAVRLAECDFAAALALARLPKSIKGFGPVKEAAARQALARRERLLAKVFAPPRVPVAEPIDPQDHDSTTQPAVVNGAA